MIAQSELQKNQAGCETKVYRGGSEHLAGYYSGITGKRILDIGCGTGYISSYLQDHGSQCYGITVSKEEAVVAREKMTEVLVLDLEQIDSLPFDEGSFDVAVFSDVLEHLKNPRYVLERVKLYLKPEALLIATIPNIENFDVRFNLLFGKFDYQPLGILDDTHLRFFTLRTARKLISSAGYAIQDIKYTNWNWLFPKWFRRSFSFCEWELKQRLTRLWPGMFATQFVIYALYACDSKRGRTCPK